LDRQQAEAARPLLLSFPAEDGVLREHVRELVDDADARPAADLAPTLQAALRVVYPRVSVRLQHALAGFGQPTLYVFRDGGATSGLDPDDWTTDEACAWVVTDDHGNYVDANDAAEELFGVPRNDIIGQPAGTFTRPDARIKHADEMWALLAQTGSLHSLALVSRADGTDVRVEFVTVRDGARPGFSVTTMRRVS